MTATHTRVGGVTGFHNGAVGGSVIMTLPGPPIEGDRVLVFGVCEYRDPTGPDAPGTAYNNAMDLDVYAPAGYRRMIRPHSLPDERVIVVLHEKIMTATPDTTIEVGGVYSDGSIYGVSWVVEVWRGPAGPFPIGDLVSHVVVHNEAAANWQAPPVDTRHDEATVILFAGGLGNHAGASVPAGYSNLQARNSGSTQQVTALSASKIGVVAGNEAPAVFGSSGTMFIGISVTLRVNATGWKDIFKLYENAAFRSMSSGGGDETQPLNGMSPALAEGDVLFVEIVMGGGTISNSANGGGLKSSGYTILDLNSTNPASLWAYKVMGATPDANIEFYGEPTYFRMASWQAYRNVDPVRLFNAAVALAGGASGMPNPPSATTTIKGTRRVIFGAIPAVIEEYSGFFAPANFSNGKAYAIPTGSSMVADKEDWDGGALDPGAFIHGASSANWRAGHLALHPITPQVVMSGGE